MKLQYIGRLSDVQIKGVGTIKRGAKPVDIPERLAKELLARKAPDGSPEWQTVTASKPKEPKEKPKKD